MVAMPLHRSKATAQQASIAEAGYIQQYLLRTQRAKFSNRKSYIANRNILPGSDENLTCTSYFATNYV